MYTYTNVYAITINLKRGNEFENIKMFYIECLKKEKGEALYL